MIKTLIIQIKGQVQGVGFRPFVYNKAVELALKGHVCNTSKGVLITCQGENRFTFLDELKMGPGKIEKLSYLEQFEDSFNEFKIISSKINGNIEIQIPKDLATCKQCLQEMNNPNDRRFGYPFINCIHCGPRYSIINDLPYDRCFTSMDSFKMCETCSFEYSDMNSRRFHAQPNACPKCGPQLKFFESDGFKEKAIEKAVQLLLDEKILAIKGLGGFHLMCLATSSKAIATLRKRKFRPLKPLAVMAPNISEVTQYCNLSEQEKELITSKEAPIVLLQKIREINPAIAPNNPILGVMLPYTPLHHLIVQSLKQWLVCTSGNRFDEAICIDNQEAIIELKEIADGFLIHDRPIVRPLEDSIVKIVKNRPLFIRRARGYAPTYITGKTSQHIGLGGELKNTLSVALTDKLIIGPYRGDLKNVKNKKMALIELNDLIKLNRVKKVKYIGDLHPHFQNIKVPDLQVQHHLAHIASVIGEWNLRDDVLGIAFDGTGIGLDGTIWGGEFISIREKKASRLMSFKSFLLYGGQAAILNPWRVAYALLENSYALDFLDDFLTPTDKNLFLKSCTGPECSSVGRLFDGVAVLAGFKSAVSFEAQAAIWLEHQADNQLGRPYSFEIKDQKIDWRLMIEEIVTKHENSHEIAQRFHGTLVEMILQVAKVIGIKTIVLNGGCFQNSLLLRSSIEILETNGFKVFWPKNLPANDGGLSFGQVMAKEMSFKEF